MFTPLLDRVVIAPDKNDRSKGGLYLPDLAIEKPSTGLVLAVGPGKPDINGKVYPLPVKPGDRVLYYQHAGINFDTFLIVGINDVMGIFENEEELQISLELN